jgi:hypothetical protein
MSFLPLYVDKTSREERLFNLLHKLRFLHLVFIFIIWCVIAYNLLNYEEAIVSEFHYSHVLMMLPLPYVLCVFTGLFVNFDDTSLVNKSDKETSDLAKQAPPKLRNYDRIFICLVTKGINKDAVYRSWDALKILQESTRGVFVYVVSDEPYYFEDLNTVIVPSMFECRYARAKARALEYFRQQMRLTEKDWVLHLDEV